MTATKNELIVTLPSGCEILMTRVFDAPRELVFEAMTKPEHVRRWWGPRNTTFTICEIDFRVGGTWRYVLATPDGKEVAFRGVYHEITPPERMVCTECYVEPRYGNPEWRTTLTLEDLGGKTRLTSRVLHSSTTNRDGHLNSGVKGGAAETFERLEELLAAHPMEREIEIERTFDAPRELVYEAWTNPGHLTQWWGPMIFTNHSCELDVRQGGAWQITMRSSEGVDHQCRGVYSEVVKPERLVFSNDAFDQTGRPLLKGFTTVIFDDENGKTKLTLRSRVVGLVDYAPQMLKGMHTGWSQSLDRLASFVK